MELSVLLVEKPLLLLVSFIGGLELPVQLSDLHILDTNIVIQGNEAFLEARCARLLGFLLRCSRCSIFCTASAWL